MTTLALHTATRSLALMGRLLDALAKAVAMKKAVSPTYVNTRDIDKVRAIADTL